MAIRNIRRQATVPGFAIPTAAPIYVNSSDNKLKMIPAGSGTTEVEIIDASTTQTLTGKTLADAAGTVKLQLNSAAKTIVDGSATPLFSLPVAALTSVGGLGFYHVRASDGTDFQAMSGIFSYAAVAKGTAVTATITNATGNDAKAVSAGTLTLAFTADATVNNVVTYKLQPTGSLTETTPYTIEYTLFPIRGVVTIL